MGLINLGLALVIVAAVACLGALVVLCAARWARYRRARYEGPDPFDLGPVESHREVVAGPHHPPAA